MKLSKKEFLAWCYMQLCDIIEKYWGTRRHVYKHQEERIWRLIHNHYPDVAILSLYGIQIGRGALG